MDQRRYYGDSS